MPVFSTSLPRAALLGAVFLPGAAFADLSTNDVWQHFQTVSGLYGGTLNGETTAQGDSLKITDMTFAADLPFGLGAVSLNLGDMTLRQTSDATVSMIYPETMAIELSYTSSEGKNYGGGMTVTQDGLMSEASGTPNKITFDYAAKRIDLSIDIPELPQGYEGYHASGYFTDLSGQSVHNTASGLVSDARLTMGRHAFNADQTMSLDDEEGPVQIKSGSGGASMTATGHTVIPADGIHFANLAAALRDGFEVAGSASITEYTTDQLTTQDGTVIARQNLTAASYDSSVAMDDTGFQIEGPSKNLRLEIETPTMEGVTFGANIASAYGKIRAPLLKDESFAPAEIKIDLLGLEADEALWAMGDPKGVLPHDPADLSLDLTGDIRHRVEWLDFANVDAAMEKLTGLPVEPQSLRLNTLRLAAVGAEITGEGAFTFDLTDLQSFGGMPRPEGKLTLRATGLNALSENLRKLGMPEDQISSGLMMLGMFTTPDPEGGDDSHMSVLEVTPEGQVFNNGMRLR